MAGIMLDHSHLSSAAQPALKVVNYIAALLTLVVILIWARPIVIAVLVGVGIGVLLAPALQAMHRVLRVPRGLAAALLAIVGIAAITAIIWGISSVMESQVALLAERGPELIQRLQGYVQHLLSRYPWVQRNMASLDLASELSGIGAILFKGAWSGLGVLSAMVFAGVIGLYVAVEAQDYYRGAVRAMPAANRPRADRFLLQAAQTIRMWFNAQLIDMVIIGGLTSIGLWAAGAEYWLLLGVLTALFGIIPYVGIGIVVLFAALLTLGSDAGRLPWVLAVFIATQQLEGNVILPLVMRGRARLPAVPLLVFMLLMGTWAGLLGVLMAPPLFAVLLLAYREFYLPRVDRIDGDDAPVPSDSAQEPSSRTEATAAGPAD